MKSMAKRRTVILLSDTPKGLFYSQWGLISKDPPFGEGSSGRGGSLFLEKPLKQVCEKIFPAAVPSGKVPGRIGKGILSVFFFQHIPVLYDPNIEIAGTSSLKMRIEPFFLDNLNDRLVDIIIPGNQGVGEGDLPGYLLVKIVFMYQDMIVDYIVAAGSAEIHIVTAGQFSEFGFLVKGFLFLLQQGIPQFVHGHIRGDPDLAGKAGNFGVDGLHALGLCYGNPVIAVPYKINSPDFIKLNRRQDDRPVMGFVHPFPAAAEMIRIGEKIFVKVPVPAFASHDQADGYYLHALIRLVFGFQYLFYRIERQKPVPVQMHKVLYPGKDRLDPRLGKIFRYLHF
jgi:hypothetical protein